MHAYTVLGSLLHGPLLLGSWSLALGPVSFLGGHDIGHKRVYKPGSKDFQGVLIG